LSKSGEEHKNICQESPKWPSKLSLSEVMTILVMYHHLTGYRNFKRFYQLHLGGNQGRRLFPNVVSYSRMVELIPLTLIPLMNGSNNHVGYNTGISLVDSTKLIVCHNKRSNSNKVFRNLAARGKSTMGWFYGFKLHLIINEKVEILAARVTPGNVDDCKPILEMTKFITGKLFADKGYISKELTEKLLS
jgi:hypothetical protein